MTKESLDPFYESSDSAPGKDIRSDVDSTISLIKSTADKGGDVNSVLADEINKEMQKLQSKYQFMVGTQSYFSQKLYQELSQDDKAKQLFPHLVLSNQHGIATLLVQDKAEKNASTNKSVDTTHHDDKLTKESKNESAVTTGVVSKDMVVQKSSPPVKSDSQAVNDQVGNIVKDVVNKISPINQGLQSSVPGFSGMPEGSGKSDDPAKFDTIKNCRQEIVQAFKLLREEWRQNPTDSESVIKTRQSQLSSLNELSWELFDANDRLRGTHSEDNPYHKQKQSSTSAFKTLEYEDIVGTDDKFNSAIKSAYLRETDIKDTSQNKSFPKS